MARSWVASVWSCSVTSAASSSARRRRGRGAADTALRGWAPARRGGINVEEGGLAAWSRGLGGG